MFQPISSKVLPNIQDEDGLSFVNMEEYFLFPRKYEHACYLINNNMVWVWSNRRWWCASLKKIFLYSSSKEDDMIIYLVFLTSDASRYFVLMLSFSCKTYTHGHGVVIFRKLCIMYFFAWYNNNEWWWWSWWLNMIFFTRDLWVK